MCDGLDRNNFAERKFRIAAATPPMMMTLRGKEKGFDIAAESLQQLFEGLLVRGAADSILLGEDPLRILEVVRVAVTFKNEIEAMN